MKRLRLATNWYKSATAMVGGALILVPSLVERFADLTPHLGEDGVMTLALIGAVVLAARAVKQDKVSGRG